LGGGCNRIRGLFLGGQERGGREETFRKVLKKRGSLGETLLWGTFLKGGRKGGSGV